MAWLQVRCIDGELEAWKRKASKAGKTLSGYVRDWMNGEEGEVVKGSGEPAESAGDLPSVSPPVEDAEGERVVAEGAVVVKKDVEDVRARFCDRCRRLGGAACPECLVLVGLADERSSRDAEDGGKAVDAGASGAAGHALGVRDAAGEGGGGGIDELPGDAEEDAGEVYGADDFVGEGVAADGEGGAGASDGNDEGSGSDDEIPF